VPGIDVLFIGPWDLGNNIGRPVLGEFHEDLQAAIEKIRKAAVNAGKKSGIYCVGGEAAKKYADQGFDFVSCHPTFSNSTFQSDNVVDFRRGRCSRSSNLSLQCFGNRESRC
jgi:2-keto-3-deoxy-L-rhamnonate aldolase RhmA